ncbi:hypothetical protein J4457_04760 [Candidatus Woesearchaeota archaeon]|nr:hypothetical protein [Candidatus Woesearchaeota archaeon]
MDLDAQISCSGGEEEPPSDEAILEEAPEELTNLEEKIYEEQSDAVFDEVEPAASNYAFSESTSNVYEYSLITDENNYAANGEDRQIEIFEEGKWGRLQTTDISLARYIAENILKAILGTQALTMKDLGS